MSATSSGLSAQRPTTTVSAVAMRRTVWRRLWKNKALTVGGGLLAIIFFLALFAPWISPHDPYVQDLAYRTVPPVWYEKGTWLHPLGTDQFGRDYMSRVF